MLLSAALVGHDRMTLFPTAALSFSGCGMAVGVKAVIWTRPKELNIISTASSLQPESLPYISSFRAVSQSRLLLSLFRCCVLESSFFIDTYCEYSSYFTNCCFLRCYCLAYAAPSHCPLTRTTIASMAIDRNSTQRQFFPIVTTLSTQLSPFPFQSLIYFLHIFCFNQCHSGISVNHVDERP